MKILILNGPNLNLLGKREPEIYGKATLGDIEQRLRELFPEEELEFRQSNHEGELIDILQGTDAEGVVLNAGAYTHTSLALADCISGISVPVIEVHLSNIYGREEIRRRSLLAPNCRGSIIGLGARGYELAIRWFTEQ